MTYGDEWCMWVQKIGREPLLYSTVYTVYIMEYRELLYLTTFTD